MEESINQDKIVEFIRSNMEPVPMDSIMTQFAGSGLEADDLKLMLQKILGSAINSGQLVRCNNHYFSSSLADDLLEVVDLNAAGDVPYEDDDGDIISFSSCESSEKEDGQEAVEQMECVDTKEDELNTSSSEYSKNDEIRKEH